MTMAQPLHRFVEELGGHVMQGQSGTQAGSCKLCTGTLLLPTLCTFGGLVPFSVPLLTLCLGYHANSEV